MSGIADPALDNPHARTGDVHYRLYLSPGGPTVLCVQSFDYDDYDAERFLTTDAYGDEAAAERALNALLADLAQTASPQERDIARRLATANGPLTRRQTLLWHLENPPEILVEDVIVVRPQPHNALDLLGGYIGHVAQLRRATNAYTLADRNRIARYARHAHLTEAQKDALTAQVAALAAQPVP